MGLVPIQGGQIKLVWYGRLKWCPIDSVFVFGWLLVVAVDEFRVSKIERMDQN